MARKTKSESVQTRERILDAAEAEMLACGVGNASLEKIARRAAVTRGAIYWHFSDKTELVQAMIARTKMPLRELRRCLSNHIPGASPLQLLREMMLHGVNRLASDEQHRRVCHIIMHRCERNEANDGSERLLSAMFDDARDVLISICEEISLERCLAEGLNVEDAGGVLLAYMCGLYECSLRHPLTYALDVHTEAKINALLYGLFPVARQDTGTPEATTSRAR